MNRILRPRVWPYVLHQHHGSPLNSVPHTPYNPPCSRRVLQLPVCYKACLAASLAAKSSQHGERKGEDINTLQGVKLLLSGFPIRLDVLGSELLQACSH